MIELVDGFWCDPFEVRAVKKIGENKCALFMSGMGAMDGFVIEYPAVEVVDAVNEACEEGDDEDK